MSIKLKELCAVAGLAILLSIAVPECEGARLLGQADKTLVGWSFSGGETIAGWAFSVSNVHPGNSSPYYSLGHQYLWTEDGQVIFNSENEPDWSGFVAFLTNGKNEVLMFHRHIVLLGDPPSSGGGGSGDSESDFFGTTTDLIGYNIEYMTFEVTNFVWDDIGNVDADVTLSIYGTPEPSTLLLLGFGAVMVRKKHS